MKKCLYCNADLPETKRSHAKFCDRKHKSLYGQRFNKKDYREKLELLEKEYLKLVEFHTPMFKNDSIK